MCCKKQMFSSVHKLSNDESTPSPSHHPPLKSDVSEHDPDTFSGMILFCSHVDVEVSVAMHGGNNNDGGGGG